eukprot:6477375-Prymnesium_polylepis.1
MCRPPDVPTRGRADPPADAPTRGHDDRQTDARTWEAWSGCGIVHGGSLAMARTAMKIVMARSAPAE